MDTTAEVLKNIDEEVGKNSGWCSETDASLLNITNTQKIIQVIGEEVGSGSQDRSIYQKSTSEAEDGSDGKSMVAFEDSKAHSNEGTSCNTYDHRNSNNDIVISSSEQNSNELPISPNEEKKVNLPEISASSMTSVKSNSVDISVDSEHLDWTNSNKPEHYTKLENVNKEHLTEELEKNESETKVEPHAVVGEIPLLPDVISEQPPTKRQKIFHTVDIAEKAPITESVESSEDLRTGSGDFLYTAEKANLDATIIPDLTKGANEDPDTNSLWTSNIYKFEGPPCQLTGAWGCFISEKCNNYLRGCKWAPDGTCLLTATNDNCVQVFDTPEQLYDPGRECADLVEMVPVLKMKEADTIYDYCWYSKMSSSDPDKACLAITSRSTPVHLFDAFTSNLKCSYRAYSQVDDLVAAYSLSFDPTGTKLYCGFNKMIRVFDVNRPGREFVNRPTYAKEGQSGIISCIAHSPTETGLYAAGSYARSIALYKETKGEMICMFDGQQGGVTHIMFSPDGTKLYSGGRKDNEILCWDLRNPGHILYTMERKVCTNQRIYFDITQDGRFVISGCHDGFIRVWDTLQPPVQYEGIQEPILPAVMSFKAHSDTVNGVSLHPFLPVVATSSGQRHYPSFNDSSDENTDKEEDSEQIDNSLKLWRIT